MSHRICEDISYHSLSTKAFYLRLYQSTSAGRVIVLQINLCIESSVSLFPSHTELVFHNRGCLGLILVCIYTERRPDEWDSRRFSNVGFPSVTVKSHDDQVVFG